MALNHQKYFRNNIKGKPSENDNITLSDLCVHKLMHLVHSNFYK